MLLPIAATDVLGPFGDSESTSLWTPLEFGADLASYFNDYDAATVQKTGPAQAANGDAVVGWVNQGVLFPDGAAPPGDEPTLVVAGQERYLTFATTDRLDVFDGAISLAQPFAILMRFRFTSLSATQGIMDGIGSDCAIYYDHGTGKVSLYAGGSVGEFGDADTTSDHYLYAELNGASSIIQFDGGAPQTVSPGTNGIEDGIRLANNRSTTAPFQGRLKAHVIVSRALSTPEKSSANSWLADLP
jgi:hypothetical protein